MEIQTGDVIYIFCLYSRPQKYKYAICVCPQHPLFFFINTHPRRSTPDAQVYISKSELPCLDRDSYINTAVVVTFQPREVDNALKKGTIGHVVKERIIQAVSNHEYLPQAHKQTILNNLRVK